MNEDDLRIVTDIARDVRIAMITSGNPDGKLTSHPMTTQQVDFDGTAWFFVSKDADLVRNIAHDDQVNVAYSGSGSWLSLSGTGLVVDDEERKKELWNELVEAWFPDGSDDPNVVLLKVNADSAEYWSSPGGKPRALFEMAKARLTGKEPNPGHNDTVTL
ncbi:pyridoxamine 5'-phosphate oxidase family protein [Amycolatopsis sp. NPDC089917]|uniref:pyridoxamine 5'-phosphate oxidase family protein n=1 Tax=Amycolatopsis sp. NPDC089917 TaxID=3155187 RepID=UPI0034271821